ncbi:amidase family protein [Mycobacterium tuberculosis]
MTEGAYLGYHPSLPTPVNPWTRQRGRRVLERLRAWPPRRDCAGSIGSDTSRFAFRRACCGVTGIKPTWAGSAVTASSNLRQATTTSGRSPAALHDAAVLPSVIRDPISTILVLGGARPDYAADLALTRIPRVGVDWSQTTSFDEDTTAMLADVVKTLDDIGWPVIDVKLPRACADGGSAEKCARSKRRSRMPTPTRRAPMSTGRSCAMIDAGHRLAG